MLNRGWLFLFCKDQHNSLYGLVVVNLLVLILICFKLYPFRGRIRYLPSSNVALSWLPNSCNLRVFNTRQRPLKPFVVFLSFDAISSLCDHVLCCNAGVYCVCVKFWKKKNKKPKKQKKDGIFGVGISFPTTFISTSKYLLVLSTDKHLSSFPFFLQFSRLEYCLLVADTYYILLLL